MSSVGQIERRTQARVIKLFREQLGYEFLGNWIDREDNRNVDEVLLRQWLSQERRPRRECLLIPVSCPASPSALMNSRKTLVH